jgi:GH15 family glucan-1,4-alpha-glucosidase
MSNLNLWPIGNCQVSVLVDEEAGFVWGCQPRVDGDPLFCSLLDPAGDAALPRGEWRISVENQRSVEQHYLKNTPILVTRLTDADGDVAEIFDFCPRFERSSRMYRPVAFIRIVRPLVGAPRVRIALNPATGWGARDAERTSGTNHIRYLLDPQPLRLTTDAPVTHLLEGRSFRLERSCHLFLGPDEPFVGDVTQSLAGMLHQTADHWRDWVRGLAIPLEWQRIVIRAAITLKMCQHEETGAIVAALTTSIPEAPGSGRNWDYRYCWIRDAYYTVQALNRLGALDVLENYLSYLRNVVDESKGGHIQPLYAVSGEPKLEETLAAGLAGYRGMGPVRVGNAAFTQVQHDAYGQIILSNAQAFFDERLLRKATEEDFAALEQVGELAWTKHDQPDAGLWEFRTKSSIHTYSAVMSWAACDRLANIATELHLADRARLWRQRAD